MFRISCLRSPVLNCSIRSSIPLRTPLPLPKPQLSQLNSPHSLRASPSLRHLSSSAFRQASPKPRTRIPPKPFKPLNNAFQPGSPPPTTTTLTPVSLLTQIISDAGGKVTLYVGPSHRLYRAVSYTAGIACGVLIVYCLSLGLDEQNTVALPVRVMMSFASVAWMALTWMFFSGIRGLVSRVTATTRALPLPKSPTATPPRYTELEIRVRSALPFCKDKVYRVTPENVRIDKNVVSPKPRTREEQEVYDTMVKFLEQEERIRRTSFFKAPLTKTSFVCHEVLRNTRYAFTKELMVRLFIRSGKGEENVFKFDTTGKFAPEYKYLEKVIANNLWGK